ncbi:NAD(P)H-hydrate dehydratase [Agrobacterium salinitolerans]|uniref:Bifunctional NAD(P)H-hydrate repair enzyme n=1 Tax=Agrobacterium salinitolerans TaxID=1183413 RepID=A0A4Z1R6W3_9HYPH|nr:NAD(P)H-hydrate dehydratase [Agrobacterium salinitolerans]QXC52050.1 NAD(P)H-hydrate dehydratase [Agrobacterium salinitolerans]UYZ06107.1 NAD(P)H-hydrate dehydratase [Agrobacterium salinitolerans]
MKFLSPFSLFDPATMALVDAAAGQSGIQLYDLMERAGQAVASSALRHYPQALRFVVLCGGGNNGGDGYVAARALLHSGAVVAVHHLGDVGALRGDARTAFQRSGVTPLPLGDYRPFSGDVVIDAVFGAGLSRDVPQELIRVIEAVTQAKAPVLAVDLPSGLCGRRGVPLGASFRAERTVTFMARKPGHLLMPGRALCGTLEVFDIGIPSRILDAHAGAVAENSPPVWRDVLPHADMETHKFRRGHLTVFSGPAHATGASRMTALCALKAGAGIVTIAAPRQALDVLSVTLTAVMNAPVDDADDLRSWLDDRRHGTFVLGPGFGDLEKARQYVSLLGDKAVVLDADAITAFSDHREALFARVGSGAGKFVLTPHEGEFARLFPDLVADKMLSKIERAQIASARSGAVLVYKGADTVIAAPDGRALVNTNAPASLATAGSGDVLAGVIGALLAQGTPAFEAAAAGVWLHGEAGHRAGDGMTAEDLGHAVRPFL